MFLYNIALLTILSQSVHACITAHIYQQNCVYGGDGVSAQVFDNGVEVCNGYQNMNLAGSDDTFCDFKCNAGYSLCVGNNAGQATISTPNGYSKVLTQAKSHNMRYQCGTQYNGDGNQPVYGTEYEACYYDEYPNCNDYPPCNLCDYKSYC